MASLTGNNHLPQAIKAHKLKYLLIKIMVCIICNYRRKIHVPVVIHENKATMSKSIPKLNKENSSGSEAESVEHDDSGKEFLKAYFSNDTAENSALTASLLAQVSADDPNVAASLGLLYDYYVQDSNSPTSPTSGR